MYWLSDLLEGAYFARPRVLRGEAPDEPAHPLDPWHKHRCEGCGAVWAHTEEDMILATPEEHQEGHTCPRCGTRQYWKFWG